MERFGPIMTDVDNPLDPTVFKRGLELVDLGETGKTYQPQRNLYH